MQDINNCDIVNKQAETLGEHTLLMSGNIGLQPLIQVVEATQDGHVCDCCEGFLKTRNSFKLRPSEAI